MLSLTGEEGLLGHSELTPRFTKQSQVPNDLPQAPPGVDVRGQRWRNLAHGGSLGRTAGVGARKGPCRSSVSSWSRRGIWGGIALLDAPDKGLPGRDGLCVLLNVHFLGILEGLLVPLFVLHVEYWRQ